LRTVPGEQPHPSSLLCDDMVAPVSLVWPLRDPELYVALAGLGVTAADVMTAGSPQPGVARSSAGTAQEHR